MIALQKAKAALEAAEEAAENQNIKVTTVIVDDHGSIIASSRMDGALSISPKFALAKAYTAASLRMPSGDLGPGVVPGKPYYGINTLFGGELTPMAGGLPVVKDGRVIGGVGVGGSVDTQQDVVCAKAAVKALMS